MDNFDKKLRWFLVEEGYLFPQTDAEIERARTSLVMKKFDGFSFRNHWSKWHGGAEVYGFAVCRQFVSFDSYYWSVVVLGFEFCLWFHRG